MVSAALHFNLNVPSGAHFLSYNRNPANIPIKNIICISEVPIKTDIRTYEVIQDMRQTKNNHIYLVKNQVDGQQYIIKEKKIDSQKQCRIEGDLLRRIHHPGIVKAKEQFEENGYVYLVLEYCRGLTLKEYMRTRKVSWTQLLSWAIELCETLQYLHGCKPPIIHRDIKPDNIMITPDKKIKLIDFDISRTENQKGEKSYGTKRFAAPEQFRGIFSKKTDVYNLGATLNWCMEHETEHAQSDLKIGTCQMQIWQHLIRKMTAPESKKRCSLRRAKGYLMCLLFWGI